MFTSAIDGQITGAVERLSESVVSLSSLVVARDFRFGFVPIEGAASGFIIDAKGYIVTNNHVIDRAAKVQVNLKDGRSFMGEVVGTDSATDIAVVRIEAENLPAAKVGDSDRLKVGQLVLAIGNSLGLPGGPTVSLGVISALGRPLPGADSILEGLIQTDAAINPGNSGGPLADSEGNVIGINTAMIPFAQGVGFAIPINTVKWVVEQILAKGRVIRPWLGIVGSAMNPDVARRFGLPSETGVLIVEVAPSSPAYFAGLRVGDILTRIGSNEVRQIRDLLAALTKIQIGDEAEITVIRMGRPYRISVKLVEAPVQVVRRRR